MYTGLLGLQSKFRMEKNCCVNTHALSVTGICVLINSDQRSARVRRGGHMLVSHKY